MPGVQQGDFDFGEPAVHNRGLFADHFLEMRLASMLRPQDTAAIDAAFARVLALYEAHADGLEVANEAQTEHDFVKPMLAELWGECWDVQAGLRDAIGRRQPDYAFFTSPEDRSRAETLRGQGDYWRECPVLGDAKRWEAPLDQRRDGETPSAQIIDYLLRTGVRWGILTNGRHWRLYERDISKSEGAFLEVRLADVLKRRDHIAFREFWRFFGRDAFVPGVDGTAFLQALAAGSADYARAVGDRLKDSVYDALVVLMDGMLAHPKNGLDAARPEAVQRVHDAALILLYRLLFLFYAEHRAILPIGAPLYRAYGIRGMCRDIHDRLKTTGRPFLTSAQGLWHTLRDLCDAIEQGVVEDGIVVVPAYNGGLFSHSRHPDLSRETGLVAGDRYMAEAIDLLAYAREVPGRPGDDSVDYRSLSVQYLGTIYEGLLELKPLVSDVGRVELPDSRLVPESDPAAARARKTARRIAAGRVYLATDKGERKATGSYYTPKYIVDYIVEATLDPLVRRASEEVAALRPEVRRRIAALGYQPDRAAVDREQARLLEPYLSLKVLDPAMGSGHFLVGAADYLGLAMATDPNLPEPPNGEDAVSYFRRRAVERCLYGVDLNPLAVELAKLSLWLHTVSADKALSFLDHHIRCGNSLLSARVDEDLDRAPGSRPRSVLRMEPVARSWMRPPGKARGPRDGGGVVLPYVDAISGCSNAAERDADETAAGGCSQHAPMEEDANQQAFPFPEFLRQQMFNFLGTIQRIFDTPTGDADIERCKAAWFDEMEPYRDRFRAVANCWLAASFGARVGAEEYGRALAALRKPSTEAREVEAEPWFVEAHKIAAHKRFFHWEIEFPEVFFDRNGRKPDAERGFDAVIGNPPYRLIKAQETLDESSMDAFVRFWLRGLHFARPGGLVSLITPASWLTGLNYENLRRRMVEESGIQLAVRLPYDVFRDAYIDTCIAVVANCPAPSEAHVQVRQMGKKQNPSELKHLPLHSIPLSRWKSTPHLKFVLDPAAMSLDRFRADPRMTRLGTILELTRGVQPYSRKKHAEEDIDSDFLRRPSRGGTGYLPELTGDELVRYRLLPERKSWLEYSDRLAARRPMRFFEGPRVVLRRLLSRRGELMAAFTDETLVTCDNILNGVITDDRYEPAFVVALLNSRLFARLYTTSSSIAIKDDFPQVTIEEVGSLPLRPVNFATVGKAREEDRKRALCVADSAVDSGDFTPVIAFVESCLSPTPERSDVVHDLLADLAKRMLTGNHAISTETRAFLSWLEGTVSACPIDDLEGKTRLREYADCRFDDFMETLCKNRAKLGMDPDRRDARELLKAEFERSVAVILPIKTRLAVTDRLIDQVVYRLYGLTPEEIAAVEGP